MKEVFVPRHVILSAGTDASKVNPPTVALYWHTYNLYGQKIGKEVMGAFDPVISYEKGTFIGKLRRNSTRVEKLTDRDGYRQ